MSDPYPGTAAYWEKRYDALAAELAEYKETLSICQDRNARAHAETAAANARVRELEAEFVAYKDDATTAIAMYKKDVAEKYCRIRELAAERTVDGFCHICGTYGNGETAAGG